MKNKILLMAVSMALLSGCAAIDQYKKMNAPYVAPQNELPAAWDSNANAINASSQSAEWWKLYNDPVLDDLIKEAQAHNHDLQLAAARILEAEAQFGIVDANRYPVVTANGNGSRTGRSLVTSQPIPTTAPRYTNDARFTFNASYELDLWGKYRQASKAAKAQLLSAQAARDTVMLSLEASVAQQYFNLQAADAAVATSKQVIQTRSDTLDLQRLRSDAGKGSDYDIRQAEAELASVESQHALNLQNQEAVQAALTVLLGRSPRDVMQSSIARGELAPTQALWVPDGLPSDMLLRRPDVVDAEQKLIAEHANIAAARAEYFPSISLTAYLGAQSGILSNLFSAGSGIFQFAAGLAQPIFNAGQLEFRVKAAEARREQALANYQQTVANAFKDVRDALNAQTAALSRLEAESKRVIALTETKRLADLRFDAGLLSRLEVLDADRQLLQAKLAQIDAQNSQRAAVVSLFKALGGGWDNVASSN